MQRAKARAGMRVILAEPDGWSRKCGLSVVQLRLAGPGGFFSSFCENSHLVISYPICAMQNGFTVHVIMCYNEIFGREWDPSVKIKFITFISILYI